jgi:prepilin-type N-terminal cleavage/methylation domain-containing protein
MRQKGFTLIELLIVVAIIAILAAIAIPNFLEAQVRSKVSRVKADQRSLSTAIESYYIDNNTYPSVDSSETQGFGVDRGLNRISAALRPMPTFRVKQNNADLLSTLTTPIAYIQTIFPDPFATTPGASFRYSTPAPTLAATAGWIIWSFGPNLDETVISTAGVNGATASGGEIKFMPVGQPNPRVMETIYNPNERVPSSTLVQLTYDPSNGSTSPGDVWRTKN